MFLLMYSITESLQIVFGPLVSIIYAVLVYLFLMHSITDPPQSVFNPLASTYLLMHSINDAILCLILFTVLFRQYIITHSITDPVDSGSSYVWM